MKQGKSQDGVRFLAWETDKAQQKHQWRQNAKEWENIFMYGSGGHLKEDIAYR